MAIQLSWLWLFALVSLAPCLARAQEAVQAPADPMPQFDPLTAPVFVQSGGVSLGSYGAGYTYYYTRARHHVFDAGGQRVASGSRAFRVLTGASAGSINAVLAAIAMCKPPDALPSQSVFYRAWIPVGMNPGKDGLADTHRATARALFSRLPIDEAAEVVKRYYAQDDWLSGDCNVLLGLVATRKQERKLHLKVNKLGSPSVTRQTDKFLLELRRPAARAGGPEIFSAAELAEEGIRDLYPSLGHGKIDEAISFDQVLELMKASAAFPFAFEPVDLAISVYGDNDIQDGYQPLWSPELADCRASDGEKKRECRGPQYYDGALYENVPLTLSENIGNWLDRRQGTSAPAQGATTLVLDYDSESFLRKVPPTEQTSSNLLPTLLELGGTVLSANLGAEYARAFENHPQNRLESGVQNFLEFTERELPPASNHFMNFLGFFEEDFRIFDFYLGMLDAARAAQIDLTPSPEAGPVHDEWKVFACFRQWEARSNGFKNLPAAGSVPNCTALGVGEWKQNEKGKLGFWGSSFNSLNDTQKTWYNLVRLLAAAQSYRLWLCDHAPKGLMGDTDEWLKQTKAAGVEFRQLGSKGRQLVRDTLYNQLRAVAKAQDGFVNKSAVRLVSQIVANQVDYREPKWILSVGSNAVRGFEAGVGLRSASWLRAELDITAQETRFKRNARALLGGRARLVFPLGTLMSKKVSWLELEPFASLNLNYGVGNGPTWHSVGYDFGTYLVLLQRLYLSVAYTNIDPRDHRTPSWNDMVSLNHVMGFFGWRFLW